MASSSSLQQTLIGKFLAEVQALNFVDIGCSWGAPENWEPLIPHINLIGFDPNEEECRRLSATPEGFASRSYIPVAISDREGDATLYRTKSIYCHSLLAPNQSLLSRFYSYSAMFEVLDTATVSIQTLDGVQAIKDIDVDAIKIDAQGVEKRILDSSPRAFGEAFYVDVEAGFIEGYHQQTTIGEIASAMKEKGFGLFGLGEGHRNPRDNVFRRNYGNEQIIYSETTWLKDYVELHRRGLFDFSELTRDKALKTLALCALQGCLSYGFELASLYRNLGLLTGAELDQLRHKQQWTLANSLHGESLGESALRWLLRTAPASFRRAAARALNSLEQDSAMEELVTYHQTLETHPNSERS